MLEPTVLAFIGAQSVLSLVAWRKGTPQMLRTILTIFANWIACEGYVLYTGDPTPWVWFAAVDTIACLIILRQPAGKWQAAIGAIYLGQVIVSFVFGARNILYGANPYTTYDYWLMLTRLGWLHFICFAGWTLHHGGAGSAISRVRRRMLGPVAPRSASVDR